MSPLVYGVFVLLVLLALLMLALLRVSALADEAAQGRMPLPTARQRRRWKRERLKFNPRLGVHK